MIWPTVARLMLAVAAGYNLAFGNLYVAAVLLALLVASMVMQSASSRETGAGPVDDDA